jgi:hypothetical protein
MLVVHLLRNVACKVQPPRDEPERSSARSEGARVRCEGEGRGVGWQCSAPSGIGVPRRAAQWPCHAAPLAPACAYGVCVRRVRAACACGVCVRRVRAACACGVCVRRVRARRARVVCARMARARGVCVGGGTGTSRRQRRSRRCCPARAGAAASRAARASTSHRVSAASVRSSAAAAQRATPRRWARRWSSWSAGY